ncbi:MAG: tetratricopeptide repeat protein [bacterium]|nr:tetratricopeptide repeat protein [bacterium]
MGQPTPTKLSRACDALVEGGWLAALVVGPLFFDVNTSRTFEPDRAVIVRTIATWMAVFWIAGALERRSAQKTMATPAGFGPRRILAVPLGLPVALFVVSLLVSNALSLSPWTSFWGSYERLQGTYTSLAYVVIFAAIAVHARRREQLERVLDTLVVTSVPVALYGIVQRFGLDPIDWSDAVIERVYSTLGASTFLGAYMSALLPLTIGLLVRRAGAWDAKAWLLAVAAALQATALLFSQGRGALVGAVLALFFFGLWYWVSRVPASRLRLARGLWIGGAVSIAAAVAILNVRGTALDPVLDPIRATGYGKRLATITNLERGTGKVRLLVWEGSLRRMLPGPPVGIEGDPLAPPDPLHGVRPLVGYGPESTRLAFASMHPAELAHFEDRTNTADRAHNSGVEHLLAGGLLGLVAHYFLTIAVLFVALSSAGWSLAPRRFALLLAGGALLGAALVLATTRQLALVALGAPLGLFAGLFASSFTSGARGDRARPVPLGIAAAMIADFTHTQFGFGVTATQLVFWSLAGVAVAWPRTERETHEAPREETGPARAPFPLAAALAALLLAYSFLIRESAPQAASSAIARAATVRLLVLYALIAGCIALFAKTRCREPLEAVGPSRAKKRFALLAVGAALLTWFGNVNVIRAGLFLQQGEHCVAERRWIEAIELHERARALDPRESHYSLVLARDFHRIATDPGAPPALRAGAWELGEEHALEARRLEPYDPRHAANLGRFALAWGATGRPDKLERALGHFAGALALSPQDVLLFTQLAQVHRSMGDFPTAIQTLEQAAGIDPDYPLTWVLLGDTHAVLQDSDRALAAHRMAMDSKVRGLDGFAAFADGEVDLRLEYYVGADHFEELLAALEAQRAKRPTSARVAWTLARAHIAAGAADAALHHFIRAQELGDAELAAARALAAEYPVAEFHRAAEQLSVRILRTGIEVHLALAIDADRRDEVDEAIHHNEAILDLDPANPRTLGHLAVLQRRAGRLRRAIELGELCLAGAADDQAAGWRRFLDEVRAELAAGGE